MEPVPAEPPGMLLGTEGLLIVSPDFFADEAQGLCGAQVRLNEIGIDDGEDLCSRVEVFVKAGDIGVRVRREGRIVLVVVLERKGIFGRGVVIEIGYGEVTREAAGARDEGVV